MAVVEGELVQVVRNAGSKSEHRGFVLRTADGTEIAVEKEGDNPFEHESLKPLAGRRIRATGAFYRGRLIAETVDALE